MARSDVFASATLNSGDKQDSQQPKCASSVATSTVNAQGQVPQNESGIAALRRSNHGLIPSPKSSSGNKTPTSPRRVRGISDLRGIPFFRGFRQESEEEVYKIKAQAFPY